MWDIVADFFQVYTQVFMDSSFAQWKILQISIILVSCFDTNSLATATRSKSSVPWQWQCDNSYTAETTLNHNYI